VTLRARVIGRPPAERAALAVRALDNLVAARRTRPVEATMTADGVLIGVGGTYVVGVTPIDLDPLAGETLEGVAADVVGRMQQALDEAADAHRVRVWVVGAVRAGFALLLGGVLLWQLGRIRRIARDRVSAFLRKSVAKAGLANQAAERASQLLDALQNKLIGGAALLLQLAIIYAVVTFTLRQFPYTRPWGESLRSTLLTGASEFARTIAAAIPNVFVVFAIFGITQVLIKLLKPWFEAVERGTIETSWFYPETAATTRRITTLILWLLAIAIAYPWVPGSDTDAFKGISVFVGLLVTLGSSGLVNQIMSSFMITYSRALRKGDFVKIGDVEGTITHLGMLSTKVRTIGSEEVTIPNAVVVSQTVTDYSRFADSVMTKTFVTVGYDAPWRQVHAMLLLAAERTPGIRREPKPRVQQLALEDIGVEYSLAFCLENQQSRNITKTVLHGHIQDLFNEYGVQIMTPRYETDPAAPKLVRKEQWFAAPAEPDRPPRDTSLRRPA
jgi:small-conductance mechanosensitive channel